MKMGPFLKNKKAVGGRRSHKEKMTRMHDLKVSLPRSIIDCQVIVPGVPSARKCSRRPVSVLHKSDDWSCEPKRLSEIPHTLIFCARQGSVVLGCEEHLSREFVVVIVFL